MKRFAMFVMILMAMIGMTTSALAGGGGPQKLPNSTYAIPIPEDISPRPGVSADVQESYWECNGQFGLSQWKRYRVELTTTNLFSYNSGEVNLFGLSGDEGEERWSNTTGFLHFSEPNQRRSVKKIFIDFATQSCEQVQWEVDEATNMWYCYLSPEPVCGDAEFTLHGEVILDVPAQVKVRY